MSFYYSEEISEGIAAASEIVIYGARIVAHEVAHCLAMKPYERKVSAYIVTSLSDNNPTEIDGTPVIELADAAQYRDSLVLISVLERYVPEILENLKKSGFSDIIQLSFENDDWCGIRGNIFREIYIGTGRKYISLGEELDRIENKKCEDYKCRVHIYRAVSHVDKCLTESMLPYNWELPIQVGSALTDQRIADIRDDMGDNISVRNREFCELTALYWIWKNDNSDYAGLCHYRRHFCLDSDCLEKLAISNIDVVLTLPIFNFPSVKKTYENDHDPADWEVMRETVISMYPEYTKTLEKLENNIYYFAYNMFIARKPILDNYCSWLFPVLFECAKKISKKSDIYQNRYAGFLAERLMSLYFMHHENEYRIAFSEKHFMER